MALHERKAQVIGQKCRFHHSLPGYTNNTAALGTQSRIAEHRSRSFWKAEDGLILVILSLAPGS